MVAAGNTIVGVGRFTCTRIGGLGNQLFQVATVLALAKDSNKVAAAESSPIVAMVITLGSGGEYPKNTTYNATFFHKLDTRSSNDNDQQQQQYLHEESSFHYQPIVLPSAAGSKEEGYCFKLHGYFQSARYFNHHRDYILQTLQLPRAHQAKLQLFMSRELGQFGGGSSNTHHLVAVHVRRGDYLPKSGFHNIIPSAYYRYCMQRVVEELGGENKAAVKFVVFSDDVPWCQDQDMFRSAYIVGGAATGGLPLEDYEALYVMSRCGHQIIANSSFSWWAAYMNRNPRKLVFAPSQWFGPEGPQDTQDIVPAEWYRVGEQDWQQQQQKVGEVAASNRDWWQQQNNARIQRARRRIKVLRERQQKRKSAQGRKKAHSMASREQRLRKLEIHRRRRLHQIKARRESIEKRD